MSGWHYPDSGHGPWDGPSYEPDRPDPSEFLYGEGDDTDQPEPEPHHLHDPGFQEEEVDTHHDPDHGREDHRIGAILRQGEQWPERVAFGHGDANDPNSPYHVPEHERVRSLDELLAPEGHYDDYGPEENDWEHQRAQDENYGWPEAWNDVPALDDNNEPIDPHHHEDLPEHHASTDEKFYNRDPDKGATVPHMVGGDPHDVHSIEPPPPEGAQVLHPEQTGLEYAVLAVPSPHGNGWDVIKPLE